MNYFKDPKGQTSLIAAHRSERVLKCSKLGETLPRPGSGVSPLGVELISNRSGPLEKSLKAKGDSKAIQRPHVLRNIGTSK